MSAAAGQICLARAERDGHWYLAKVKRYIPATKKHEVVFLEGFEGQTEVVRQDRIHLLPAGATAPEYQPTLKATKLKLNSGSRTVWKVGDICEGQFSEDEQWYKARIDKVLGPGRYMVTYLEYANSEETEDKYLRPLRATPTPSQAPSPAPPTAPGSKWKVGDICEGQFSEDEQWYKARIDKVLGPGRYMVTYLEYANSEETEDKYLRPLRATPTPSQAPSPAPPTAPGSKWKVGDICEGQFSEDEQWYKARIDKVLGPGHYTVTYLEYANSEETEDKYLRPLRAAPTPSPAPPTAPGSKWKVGDICEGQFSEDEQWYKARIDKVLGPGRYMVTYLEYANSEETEDKYLRPSLYSIGDIVQAFLPSDNQWHDVRIVNTSVDGKFFMVVSLASGSQVFVPLESIRQKQAPLPHTLPVAWQVGSTCEAVFSEDNQWYTAIVKAILPNNHFLVHYVDYGNDETRPGHLLRPAPEPISLAMPTPVRVPEPARPIAVQAVVPPIIAPIPIATQATPAGPLQATMYKIGDIVEGCFTGDSQWYRARIAKILDNGRQYEVTYTEYDNSEFLSPDRIRRTANASAWAPIPVLNPNTTDLRGTVQLGLDLFVKRYTGTSTIEPQVNPEEMFSAPPEEAEIAVDRQTRYKNRANAVEIFGPAPQTEQRISFSDIADALPDDNALPMHVNHMTNDLPITMHQNRILHTIEKNQVSVIKGSTGSGKTTQVPQYILDAYKHAKKKCNIICTQPRRIAAISIAKRVCEERNSALGDIVGYQVGMDKKSSNENTCLLYVTTGILLQRLIKTKTLRPFTHVIIDEVHERDKDTDFVLLIVRELLKVEPDVRVVLMSATIDTEIFQKYFGVLGPQRFMPIMNGEDRALVPEVNVEGRLYQVKIHYLDKLDKGRFLYALPPHAIVGQLISTPEIKPEMYEAAVEIITRICRHEFAADHERNENNLGSILVFLPGLAEIQELFDLIDERVDDLDLKRSLVVLPLHSTMSSDEQQKVFQRTRPGLRKIIIATNIAESSITVPDVRYVVDFCLVKEIYCDQNTKLEGLRLNWASQSACVQRSGRAGRVQNGVCFRLIPSRFFEQEMMQQAAPEIQRTSLDHLVLQVKVLKVGDPRDVLYLAMQPPNITNIEESLTILTEAGALANEPTGNVVNFVREQVYDPTGRLTRLGEIYAALPVDIRLARLIVFGIAFDLPHEALVMAACMSLTGTGVFWRPFQKDFEFFKKRLQWAGGSWSDAIASMRAFETWKFLRTIGRLSSRDERDWARRNFLNLQKLREAEDIMKDLRNRLDGVGIQIPEKETEELKKTYWTVLDRTKGPDVDIDQLFKRTEVDLLLLKLLLCAAFYPNFLLSAPDDKKDMMYARDCGFSRTINYDPWRTFILRGSSSFPHNMEKHVDAYFRKCGNITKLFVEGAKCFIQFENPAKALDGHDLSLTRDPRTGKVVIPDIPLSIYLAYKCWQMERRRNRQTRDKNDHSLSRDPKDYVGAHDFEFPFQLRFTKFLGYSRIKVHNDSVNCAVFCKDPSYAERYVMVSPSLATSSGFSGDLQASNTTLLEGRPLLPALLCMLFTHSQISLFPSNDNKTYAGVRIGTYEFNFDARFGERDVQLINVIRDDLEQLIVKDLFDRDQLRERSLIMKRRLIELITKARKLNEITKSFLSVTVQPSDWLVDAEPNKDSNADAAWEENDDGSVGGDSNSIQKEQGPSNSGADSKEPNYSTRVGFKSESQRPLSERVQRLGLTDKNLFPRLQPLGLEDHGEDSEDVEDGMISTNVETMYDRMAQSKLAIVSGAILVCRTCDAPVAPFEAISYFAQASKPNNPVFKLDTDECRGMAFTGLKGAVMCKMGHNVGTYKDGDRIMTINVSANVRVKHDDGRYGPWEKKVWDQLIRMTK